MYIYGEEFFLNNNMAMSGLVKVTLLSDRAKVPTKATPHSSGYDLYAAESVVIEPTRQRWCFLDLEVSGCARARAHTCNNNNNI